MTKVDLKSTIGYWVFVGDNLVSWKCNKQNVMPRFNEESDYKVMSQSMYETM